MSVSLDQSTGSAWGNPTEGSQHMRKVSWLRLAEYVKVKLYVSIYVIHFPSVIDFPAVNVAWQFTINFDMHFDLITCVKPRQYCVEYFVYRHLCSYRLRLQTCRPSP